MSITVKSYVAEHGLPRAVATVSALPANAFVGFLCYVEGGEGAGLYQYDGSDYEQVVSASGGSGSGSGSGSGVVALTVYATVSGSTNPLPADAAEGSLAYVSGTHAAYVKTNSAWTKLNAATTDAIAPTCASTDAFPESPTAGQLVWCSDSTDKGLWVYDGSAWKKATVS
ncbi:MAG: hypothetical protein IJM30_05035 [Thermoguttaceae bacterium]|nr:hypothetical protein [Thermoguttaceae bacterium]